MAADFQREAGLGFGWVGARKVNEHAVLVVLVDAVERAGGVTGGRPVLIRSWGRWLLRVRRGR